MSQRADKHRKTGDSCGKSAARQRCSCILQHSCFYESTWYHEKRTVNQISILKPFLGCRQYQTTQTPPPLLERYRKAAVAPKKEKSRRIQADSFNMTQATVTCCTNKSESFSNVQDKHIPSKDLVMRVLSVFVIVITGDSSMKGISIPGHF
ncbi:hypothetical protein EJ05DRAFT_202391 [Pseudovirgaria hyperparasitica]|uniref:Uncharacterized protein n=1 Tax=Pseudovirgaria hyperparasitica TaxID=470096 RepID=A0A6A6WHH2_9PEZI|nr:uncharacterized protein EJ05DRAFT_202391 [Pseudovirgaria hyperparasitica]KAF2762253.1 hypothetical protein EJ05DRAFT_202391 [Pseudovirgaria hyperparasitica]